MKKSLSILASLVLVAFGLRVYHLGNPPLLWDEGWSIGLSRLSLGEIARITALDVHPPLYYVLFKGWLALGPHEFVTRFLSLIAGVLTVPVGYHAGRLWRDARVGLLTALYMTIAPPLIYYSQITRMFALCVMFLVLGTYGLLKVMAPEKRPRRSPLTSPIRDPDTASANAPAPTRLRIVSSQLFGDDCCGRSPDRATHGHGQRPARALPQIIEKILQIDLRGLGLRGTPHLLFVIGAAGALYSFYYAGFVLTALFAYALIVAPRRWKATLISFGAVGVLFAPWVLYAAPAMLNRVGERTGFSFAAGRAVALAISGFYGLVFPYGVGWPAVYAILAVIVVGTLLGARRVGRWVFLPGLAIAATLFGAALGAQAHMFAARYTIVASPFLALALAGALGLLATEEKRGKEKRGKEKRESRPHSPFFPFSLFPFSPRQVIRQHGPFAVGAALILITTVPTITSYVYSKSYEVFDPFDPSTDWRVLHELFDADDIVFFNVLSLAGTYERYRAAGDPPWSYALRWDPVVEPLDVATARIEAATAHHDRMWFVLYKGTVAANAELKSWLDQRFYPAAAPGWLEDTLYLAYVDPHEPWRDVSLDVNLGNIVLDAARYTPGDPASTVVGVDLVWRAEGPVEQNAKVFVHLYGGAGNLVAQHDSVPVNGTRPPTTWQAGETLSDRHGLALPGGLAGPLQLVVGLYDAATGKRLRTPDGRDTVVIGTVMP